MNGSSTEYTSLNFLHLSDIHFQKGMVGGSADYEEDVRTQLENDLRELTDTLGKVDAILVTGDIAYYGAEGEYKFAQNWLGKLATIVNCDPPIILCVPGNHDVDQSVYRNTFALRSSLEKLQRCSTDDELNDLLVEVVGDAHSEELVYKPIQNYNIFASQYGCELTSKEPAWVKEFSLADGPLVRVVGLNSTLGSFHGDKRASNLFIGLKQLQSIRNYPVGLNVSLSHHPPEWLMDYEQTETYLGKRVGLQLFGHKHLHKLSNIDGNLRVSAGAVHPSRKENGWQPRYNFLKLDPASPDLLAVRIYPRVWRDDRFAPDYNVCEGKDFVEHSVVLNGGKKVDESKKTPEIEVADVEPVMVSELAEKMILETSQMVEEKSINSSDFNYGQILLRRFIGLEEFKRSDIVRKLDLDVPVLAHNSGTEKFREIFERVIERNLFENFWDAVESEHADHLFSTNPFSGRQSNGSKY